MKKLIITTITLAALTFSLNSCKKTCSECPEGTHLSVDSPKEKSCICCPTGEEYDASLGYCK